MLAPISRAGAMPCRSSARQGSVMFRGGVRRTVACQAADRSLMISRAKQYYEAAWSKGQVELMDEIMREDHEQRDMIWMRDRVGEGRASMQRGISAFRSAYPNLVFKVTSVATPEAGDGSEGEAGEVFVSWTATGTNTGPIGPRAPSGKTEVFSGISRLCFDSNAQITKSFVFRQAPADEAAAFAPDGAKSQTS
eukprot:gene3711-13779_t